MALEDLKFEALFSLWEEQDNKAHVEKVYSEPVRAVLSGMK